MAINTHHTVEEINSIRCSVVEKNISLERAAYIKAILEKSGYQTQQTIVDEKAVVGVTDVCFNLQHALYGRLLKQSNGKLVTPAIWKQKTAESIYYWEY